MVRLTDLERSDAEHMLAKSCPSFDHAPFVNPPPLAKARVALVTTAGLQLRSQLAFDVVSAEYRVLPGDVTPGEILMSHSSTNFDRTGFQQDVNVVFPIERLRERVARGGIGSLARFHYSFMGAFLDPLAYEKSAVEVASLLRDDEVDVAFLIPV